MHKQQLEAARTAAASIGAPLVVLFGARWCRACTEAKPAFAKASAAATAAAVATGMQAPIFVEVRRGMDATFCARLAPMPSCPVCRPCRLSVPATFSPHFCSSGLRIVWAGQVDVEAQLELTEHAGVSALPTCVVYAIDGHARSEQPTDDDPFSCERFIALAEHGKPSPS